MTVPVTWNSTMTQSSRPVSSRVATMTTWISDRGDREGVVAGERRVVGVPEPRGDDHGEQRGAEDARPRLLRAEHEELDEPRTDAALDAPASSRCARAVDGPLDRGELPPRARSQSRAPSPRRHSALAAPAAMP